MRKINAVFISLLFLVLYSVYADDGNTLENHFIWLDGNQINKDEYTIIFASYGTFYIGIADNKLKLSVYCVQGIKIDGTEVSFRNTPITIDLPYNLDISQVNRLRNNFRDNFLKNGNFRFVINNGVLTIISENTGEQLESYIENIFNS